jgi:hypothetical protein
MTLKPLSPAFMLAVCGAPGFAATGSVTFHKDVEPLLQAHCQNCHRPGEIGPMPLLTYQNARPWAKAIKQAVLTRKMPPWFADSSVQHYRNDTSLSPKQIEIITSWVDAGAPEGDVRDAPSPRNFIEGWSIGQPDVIVETPQPYQVPATGTIEYTYVILPTHFAEDRWVVAAEIRPSNRAVMHHAALHVRPPGSKWLREYPPSVAFVPARGGSAAERRPEDEWLTNYAPGRPAYALPPDTAFLVKAGSDFVLEFHYTTNGTAATDHSKIGLIFAKTTPAKRAFIAAVANDNFVIPPGGANYHAQAVRTLATDAVLLSAGPHMHLRGKAMEIGATYPSGQSEELVHVPRYDFNWQLLMNLDRQKQPREALIWRSGVRGTTRRIIATIPTQRPRFGGVTRAGKKCCWRGSRCKLIRTRTSINFFNSRQTRIICESGSSQDEGSVGVNDRHNSRTRLSGVD